MTATKYQPGDKHPSAKTLRSHPNNAHPVRSFTTAEGTWIMSQAGCFKLKE